MARESLLTMLAAEVVVSVLMTNMTGRPARYNIHPTNRIKHSVGGLFIAALHQLLPFSTRVLVNKFGQLFVCSLRSLVIARTECLSGTVL